MGASRVEFVNVKEFKQSVEQEDAEVYMLMFAAITDGPPTDNHRTTEIVLGSDSVNESPSEYSDFQDVFSEAKANILSEHGPNNFAIDTQGKEPLATRTEDPEGIPH